MSEKFHLALEPEEDDPEIEGDLPTIEASADDDAHRAHLDTVYPDMAWVHDANASPHKPAMGGMEFPDIADEIVLGAITDFWGAGAHRENDDPASTA